MTRDEYINQVEAVLIGYTEQAAKRLEAVFPRVPAEARKIEIEIFVDQGGEGFLDLQVSLDGPDLFVLNRPIASHARLFGTRMTDAGLEPPLPLMSGSDDPFSVQDTLTDCAAAWLATVWRRTDTRAVKLPVTVVSHDEYGSITPFDLSPRRRP
jgi:hypothetical protein